jgi:hypothetical protein
MNPSFKIRSPTSGGSLHGIAADRCLRAAQLRASATFGRCEDSRLNLRWIVRFVRCSARESSEHGRGAVLADRLGRRFGDLEAVRDISFEVAEGDVLTQKRDSSNR